MYLGKKVPKIFPAGPFFRVLQIKYLSKCFYFKKPPLPWKVPSYASALVPFWFINRNKFNRSNKTINIFFLGPSPGFHQEFFKHMWMKLQLHANFFIYTKEILDGFCSFYNFTNTNSLANFSRIFRIRTPMQVWFYLTSIYLFKFNNRNTRQMYEICSKLTNTP